MNAKCTNCGKEMSQAHSDNHKAYCTAKPCTDAFMKEAMSVGRKRKK